MTKKTRVLVVEDSLTIRERLCEILAVDPDLEVIAAASDGKQAIELCMRHRPDVITCDMMLPVMTGLAATEYIMAHCPTPILIVSASFNRGEVFRTYDALAAGAVDVLEKPRGDEVEGEWERRFVAAVKLVAKIKVITHPRGRLGAFGSVARPAPAAPAVATTSARIIALGASTGGPGALVEILRGLPAPATVPILIVLHIDEPFAAAFAEWLDAQTAHRVSYARDGAPVSANNGIVMAPPGRHLVVRHGRFHASDEAPRNSCRPSVDVLFESVAREYGAGAVGCLLTGMGRDGAAGLLAIRQAGGETIAQDEQTSVVFGMPREAIRLGAARQVLPLAAIGTALGELSARPSS